MTPSDRVRIHYRRLPDREDLFEQRIVLERPDVIVSVTDPLRMEPLREGDTVLLESGARAVWFTFPGAWHDIGRFHLKDGTFTGYYANILTPVEIEASVAGGPQVWQTIDLFLDVWMPPDESARLLDEDELEEALSHGHIDADTARRSREEASRVLELATKGSWPPPVAREWTLERIEADEATRV